MPGPEAFHVPGWIDSADWAARARRQGPLRYSDLGRRRLSRPEPGQLAGLAAWLAAFADADWEASGQPDPYTLVVVSGDRGSLAAAVLAARPRCGPALRYVLVDPDVDPAGAPPEGMSKLVPLESPALLYPSAPRPDRGAGGRRHGGKQETTTPGTTTWWDPDEHPPARGVGPLATFLTDVPGLGDGEGAIVAIEVWSRLPYDVYQRVDGQWMESRLSVAPAGPARLGPGAALELGETLVDIAVAPDHDLIEAAGSERTTLRVPSGAAGWLRRVLPTATDAVLAVVDRWDGDGPGLALDLDRIRLVRNPAQPAPVPVGGTSFSVVTWRLG